MISCSALETGFGPKTWGPSPESGPLLCSDWRTIVKADITINPLKLPFRSRARAAGPSFLVEEGSRVLHSTFVTKQAVRLRVGFGEMPRAGGATQFLSG